jgi:murein endopeptidase
MSRDKSMEATMRLLKPQAPAQQPAEVTVRNEVRENPAEHAENIRTAREPEMVLVRKTVSNSAARSMVYMSPAVKRKLKEIAYHDGRKENDMWLEAIRDWLAKKGHFNVG